ncbi:hypothetical protein BC830DRAFT_1163647 [Chytriomyces sp. MP71]|nr:hypothetical protein BC830DRAFT_1163647 [Chytriomyces sp. MP71]
MACVTPSLTLTPRQAKDWFKAVLAYALAVAFVFSPLASWFQPRTLPNIVLISTILNPAKTVGNFLSPMLILLFDLLVSAAIWAFLQTVCFDSYPVMILVVFGDVYFLAIVRSMNHGRYYVSAYVGTSMAVNCCASILGAAGTPSPDLRTHFDVLFLRDTVATYFIGVFICFLVNILVFPDFAETRVRERLTGVVPKLAQLSAAIWSALSGNLEDVSASISEERLQLVSFLQSEFGAIDAEIAQASAEVSYSYYSIKNYDQLSRRMKSLAAVLFSLQSVLAAPESQRLLSSPEFQRDVSAGMKESWLLLDARCQDTFKAVHTNLGKMEFGATENLLQQLEQSCSAALNEFEKHQERVLEAIWDEVNLGPDNAFALATMENWERLLQIDFFILATKEFASDLSLLFNRTNGLVGSKKRFRIHINQYIPGGSFTNLLKVVKMEFGTLSLPTLRQNLAHLKDLLLSPRSIYGLKSATAISCLLLILVTQPDTFKHWYMTGATGNIVVTLNPSLGQTYIAFFLTLLGAVSGAVLAFCSVTLFGKDSYAHVGAAVLIGIPFVYLMLFNRGKTTIAGVLAILAFSNYICNSYANIANPAFDIPSVYLGKVVTVITCSLMFSIVLTLVVYPALARRILRAQISALFLNLNIFYGKIAGITYSAGPSTASLNVEDSEIKELRTMLFSQLVALEPLMIFASAEPRLKAPFETAKYRKLIQSMYKLLDRLECLRLSTGEKPFEGEVLRLVKSSRVANSRAHLIETVQLLLCVYSATMTTRQKLLPVLPSATRARSSVLHDFVDIMVEVARQQFPEHPGPLQDGQLMKRSTSRQQLVKKLNRENWMRFFSYYSAIREVAQELDEVAVDLKGIFGEYCGVFDIRRSEDRDQFKIVVDDM